MRRFLDFLPAFFCALYLEHLVSLSIMMGANISPVWGFGFAGPPLGLLLTVVLFRQRTGFWRRFSRFKRCLLLVLATVGIASIPTGILVGFDPGLVNPIPGQSNPYPNPFLCVGSWLFFSAIASIIWFPLALVTSGFYCVPLWAWEGRNDPNHLAGKMLCRFPQYRWHLLRLLSFGIILLLGFIWQGRSASPTWVNSIPGDGGVLSLSSGKAPDGTEVVLAGGRCRSDDSGNDLRIVSLDANDGHIRWAQRYSDALSYTSKNPSVVSNSDGDVLVAWSFWTGALGHPVISKLSGVDGHVIWERQAKDGQLLAARLDGPIPDDRGRIWIVGIQQGQNGYWNRVLAVLDTRDGASQWEKITQRVEHNFDSTTDAPEPGQVFPLKNGDAISILPPYEDRGKTPGSMQRISGKDGATLWEVVFPWIGDYTSYGIPVVDEAHQQILTFSYANPPGPSGTIISYDLLTGKERWRSAVATHTSQDVRRAALDDAGNMVLWRSYREQVSTNLLSFLLPLPLPQRGFLNLERSIQEVYSAIDGRLLQSRSFGNSSEIDRAIISRAGSTQGDAAILCTWDDKYYSVKPGTEVMLSWRAIFPNRCFWQNLLARSPGGVESSYDFPSHAILTPSDKLVISGPSKQYTHKWEIYAW